MYTTGNEFCSDFLAKVGKFGWFIRDFFGAGCLEGMERHAREGKCGLLAREMDGVWFDLPDDKFNILADPPGWAEFLSMIEGWHESPEVCDDGLIL